MQGSVWGPLCCTGTMDQIEKRHIPQETLYKYKGLVSIPPLGMIDDELTISKCSVESVKTNSYMNNFAEMKRLEYGVKKCHKIHIVIKFYRDGRSRFLYQLHWKVQCVTSNVIQQEWPALG